MFDKKKEQAARKDTTTDAAEASAGGIAENAAGSFVGFVLLDEASIDLALLANHLKEEWGIIVPTEEEQDSFVAEIEGMMVAVSLMPAPIPNDEAVSNAKTNWRWREAVSVAEAHKAHIMIAVLRREQSVLDAAVLHVKICTACLMQPHATAINTLGSVIAPDFYIDFAKGYLSNKEFPIMNLVFFGLYSTDSGQTCCGYTYGIRTFGKKEIEIINSTQQAQEVHDFMANIADYVITSDVTLRDGETIGFSAEQKLPITESAGAALGEVTLKIGF